MKLYKLVCIIFCICVQYVFAQTSQINQSKYWFYRYRLLKEFIAKGEANCGYPNGLSIPVDVGYQEPSGNHDPITGRIADASFSYGDGTSFLGYYIGVLATEFRLLNYNGASGTVKNKVLDELYYAMKAYERLDKNAETLVPATAQDADCNDDENGFFLRDDVPASTVDPSRAHDLNGEFKYTMNREISSDFGNNVNHSLNQLASPPNVGTKGDNMFNSQDQIVDLMIGFSLVAKLMDGVSRNGYNFKDNAKKYVDDMMNYLYNHNYTIPIPGYPDFAVHGSFETTVDAFALSKAGDMIHNDQLGQFPKIGLYAPYATYDNTITNLTEGFWTGLDYPVGQYYFDGNVKITNGQLDEKANDWNNAIIFALAAIGDSWTFGITPHKIFDQNVPPVIGVCPQKICPPELCILGKCIQPPCVNGWGPCTISLGHVQVWCYSIPADFIADDVVYQIATALGLGESKFSKALLAVLSTLGGLNDLGLCTPFYNPNGDFGLPGLFYNNTGHSLSKYGDKYNTQLFTLLHRVLQDNKGDYSYDEGRLTDILNSAPCNGPHFYPYNDPNVASNIDPSAPIYSTTAAPVGDEGVYGWRNDNRWEKTVDATMRGNVNGSFNGLDYMLFYNLYEIVHADNGYYDGYSSQLDLTATNLTFPQRNNGNVTGSDLHIKTFAAYEDIVSDNVTVNAGTINTDNNGNVIMHAGESIKITNLKVKSGADFKAYISPLRPCENNSSSPSNQRVVHDTESSTLSPEVVDQFKSKLQEAMINQSAAIGKAIKDKQQESYQPLNNYIANRNTPQSAADDNISMFPNPVVNQLIIQSFSSIKSVVLIDRLGNELSEQPIKYGDFKVSISMENLPSGIYYVKIFADNGVKVKQVIKSN